ncbi:MAG: response regulator [Thermodesulfobacteriota bacterium]
MADPILDTKKILVVDDEPDVLAIVEEEIKNACQNVMVEKETTYEGAEKLLTSHSYDIVILDIMGVRGFELLEIAVKRGFNVAMLTAQALSPEALKKSHDLGARAYLPKEELGRLVPFLEDILKYNYKTGWKRLFDKLENFFDEQFKGDWKDDLGIRLWF